MPDLNTPLTRYVALVPGIMGSTLSYPRGEIWGSNIIKNYWRLSNASTKLRWVGTKAEAELWKTIEVTPGVKLRLWNKTLNYLDAHPQLEQNRLIECPYDWRQSLQDSAVDIVRLLESRTGRRLSDTPGPQRERIAIVTHSMGALAIRVAIGKKLLDPGWIDRLIHMAPPLLGAPVAFRSLIYKTTVPFLNELFRVVHFLNYHRFIDNLFNAFQTFPSIYELMPPTQIEFVLDAARKNTPLTGDWFDDLTLVSHAVQTHGFIAQAHKILDASHTPVFSIFSDFCKQRTDWEYLTATKKRKIKDCVSFHEGDGTVPAYSADVTGIHGSKSLPIQDVGHMWMPNRKKAVDLLEGCGL
jgi:hypothetical protein